MASRVKKFTKLLRSTSRGKHRLQDEEQPLNEHSPRTVIFENSVEDLFNKHRSSAAAFDQEPIQAVPITRDGSIRSSNPFADVDSNILDEFDISDRPDEKDYDFGQDTFYSEDFQPSESSINNNFSNHSYPSRRSMSAQRPRQETNGMSFVGTVDDAIEKSRRRRSKSTGRSDRREQMREATLRKLESTSKEDSSSPKKRKSKMEKIIQLQEKNQRYKDEFRKVQKDRKALKKEVENKKLETAALTKEIDTHIAEISILKLKLSEALQQLDRTDQDERKDRTAITKLQKELSAVKVDYNSAVSRLSRMRDEVDSMKTTVARKDEQIKALTTEVSEQAALVDNLHSEIVALKAKESHSDKVHELQAENGRLEKELGSTLQRASSMVKEREDAIADLLKENEELKRIIEQEKGETMQQNTSISQEEIDQLRHELDAAEAALEESQDRTVLLEEEVEAWIIKGEEMETEINQLRDDVEAWQRKATAAEKTIEVVEASAHESAKKVAATEAALKEAERKHNEELLEQERRHKEAVLDVKQKAAEKIAEAEKATNMPPPNPQEMMLQKAVADRQRKQSAINKGGWGNVISRLQSGSSELDEEVSEEQKRIRDLETANADQEDDIKKLKSEMVRMRSTYNDTMYNNKKRIEQLEQENEQYAAKQKALELELKELRAAQANFPDLLSSPSSVSR